MDKIKDIKEDQFSSDFFNKIESACSSVVEQLEAEEEVRRSNK
jgi:hypothetical protein